MNGIIIFHTQAHSGSAPWWSEKKLWTKFPDSLEDHTHTLTKEITNNSMDLWHESRCGRTDLAHCPRGAIFKTMMGDGEPKLREKKPLNKDGRERFHSRRKAS